MSDLPRQTVQLVTLEQEAFTRRLDAGMLERLAGARRLGYVRLPTLPEVFEDAYARLLKSSRAALMPVWLGATPYEAHWCDWSHQVILGAGRNLRMKDVGDAWTRAASTMPPQSQWLLWLEVVSRIFDKSPETRLVAFVPEVEIAGNDYAQLSSLRASFISSWTRLLPATLILPSDAAGEHWLRSAGYQDLNSPGASSVAQPGESFKDSLAQLLQAYSVDGLTARRFAVACVESGDTDTAWNLTLFRELLAATLDDPKAGLGGSPADVASRRRRTALRLAFLMALHHVKQTLAQQVLSENGYRAFYSWQEAPLWGKEAGQRLVHALHRPATPLEPILPRFSQEYDAFTFIDEYRQSFAKVVGLVAGGGAASALTSPDSLNKVLVGLFSSDIGDLHGDLTSIFERIDSLPLSDASPTQRRYALLVLADLASRNEDLARRCWSTICAKEPDSIEREVLAARIMLGEMKFEDLEKTKLLPIRDRERLKLRYIARNGDLDALRLEASKPASGNLPNDMMRCIFAWSLISYTKGQPLDEQTARNRITDSFALIGMETLVRFRRTHKIDEFQPAVVAKAEERVFISYKAGHRAADGATRAAEQIGDALSEEGYNVFMDPQLSGGEEWSPRILSELISTRIVIGVQSAGYAHSDWCRVERRISRLRQNHHDDRARFIPVLLDGTQEINDPSEPLGELLLTNPLRAETTQDGGIVDLTTLLSKIFNAIELQVGQGKRRRNAQLFHKGL